MFEKRKLLFSTLLACTLLLVGGADLKATTNDIIEIGKFSAAVAGSDIPPAWKPLTFRKIKQHTRYTLVVDNGVTVVQATSNASASGLIRDAKINPKTYPVITWRWKVTKVYKKAEVTDKRRNDYPARIYITFKYDPGRMGFFEKLKFQVAKTLYGKYPPMTALNYIWASKAPVGKVTPDPYTERSMLIVVQSGRKKLNRWVEEERNVYKDYIKAFGQDPPPISGIAIMADSDNTEESTISFFGDIVFRQK
jgi:hypothetical protein